MIVVRSILLNIAFVLWTTVVGVLAGASLLLPDAWVIRVQVLWSDGVITWISRLAGIRLEVRGRQNLPEGSYIVASKHQSAWDTAVYHSLLKAPSIVLKKELLAIPLYGLYCRRTLMIPVDRSGHASAMRNMLRIARKVVAAGRPIMIFPEGTRVAPGEHKPYLVGIAGLYRSLKVPVVPVALNSGVFWPRDSYKRYPGTIVVEFLEPIPPGLSRTEFMDRLATAISTASDRLVDEARAAHGGPPDAANLD